MRHPALTLATLALVAGACRTNPAAPADATPAAGAQITAAQTDAAQIVPATVSSAPAPVTVVGAAAEPVVGRPAQAARVAIVTTTVASAPVVAAKPAGARAPDTMTGSLPGDVIPPFKATVRRPSTGAVTEQAFDSRSTKATTVYVVMSTQCPYCHDYLDRIKAIETRYMKQGVDVVHVYPIRSEPTAEKIAWHAQQGLRGGQIIDADAAIAHLLQADRTPTVYVAAAGGLILYRGGIDDSPANAEGATTHLANALDAVLAGKPVEVTVTDPAG